MSKDYLYTSKEFIENSKIVQLTRPFILWDVLVLL